MALAFLVLEIVAPVFLLAGLGLVWVKSGLEYRVAFVSTLAMKLALPALVFMSLVSTELTMDQIARIAVAAVTAHLVLIPAFWLLTEILKIDRPTFLAPLIFGNTGNLGLPLSLFAFGQAGLEVAVVVLAVSLIMSFTYGIWLVSGGGSFVKILKEPSVIAIPLALGFVLTDTELPKWLANTLNLIGQMAIPMMLMTLGVAVGRLRPVGFGQAAALAIVKLMICFGLSWAVASWFALTDIEFAVLVLQMTTPVAVTSYLIAEAHGAHSEKVAGLVVASTALSVLSLPLILSILI